mgnify:CR=1 FL=1
MPITDPLTSSTYKPGYKLNPAAGFNTNTNWKSSLVDLLAYKWASSTPEQRSTWLGSSWNSALYGEPDASDGMDPTSGDVYTSPSTLMALGKYVDAYQPGADSYIDQLSPYVAPNPNEYIESMDAITNRVAQANADRNFGLAEKQEARLAYGQQLEAQLGQARIASQAASDAAQSAATLGAANIHAGATKYAADVGAGASRYGTQGGLLSSIFGTKGNIYGTQEASRLGALQSGGSLAGILQQIKDSRVSNIIQNLAEPGDWVRQEYEKRALAPPPGYAGPTYEDDPRLSEALSRLLGYQPGAAPSMFDDAKLQALLDSFYAGGGGQLGGGTGGAPGAGEVPGGGDRGTVSSSAPSSPPLSSAVGGSQVPAPDLSPKTVNDIPVYQRPAIAAQPGGIEGALDPDTINAWYASKGMTYNPATSGWDAPKAAAHGMISKGLSSAVVGDPQTPGKPNPELVMGKDMTVIPMNKLSDMGRMMAKRMPHRAEGTGYLDRDGNWVDTTVPELPVVPPTNQDLGGTREDPYAVTTPATPVQTTQPAVAQPVVTQSVAAPQPIATQPPLSTTVAQPTNEATVADRDFATQPLDGSPALSSAVTEINPQNTYALPGQPGYVPPVSTKPEALSSVVGSPVAGTPTSQTTTVQGAPTATPLVQPPTNVLSGAVNNPNLSTYPDEVLANLPVLQYLKDQRKGSMFNTLSTASVPGAFGSQIPEAGAYNARQIYEIAQDPVAMQMLSSIFRSANRDMFGEFMRTLNRAPRGNAVSLSSILT